MSDVVQQARELLAGITPGKWTYRDVIDGRHNVTVDMWDVASCSGGPVEDEAVRTRYAAANAEFIAAAPQLVSELANEVEQLQFAESSLLGELRAEVARLENLRAEHAEWVKARTIETVEQLDALPEGSVIHVPHKVTASSVEHRHGRWWPSRSTGPYHHGFRDELLPARLLWHPEVDHG